MQLMMTLPVQLTATYELKLQQKHLQSKTVYAIRNFGDMVINNFKGKYFLPFFTILLI